MATHVRQATASDLDLIVPLFDTYRQFYGHGSDPGRGRRFVEERLERAQSTIFLAFHDSAAVGFTQLYPSFSSGAMARIFILNDLFVLAEARGSGAGSALLRAAAEFGRHAGAVRMMLSTEITNTAAQSLYERSGWKRDTEFLFYQLTL
jgi:ribosomal protein S18 acetylase RimI-like enzyme